MLVGEASIPEGMRIYAIGDVHGCAQLLASCHNAIRNDVSTNPIAHHSIVHIGDYVDRGPDSAGVIARLADLSADPDIVCLRGNHDQMMLDFLEDPEAYGAVFLANGGKATLRSYGIGMRGANYATLAARLDDAIPLEQLEFLHSLRYSAHVGDYFFCHAGVRPGVPLEAQIPSDLLWIREDFLFDPRDHGAVVVHGHTPAETPEIRANRIGIDTGAVFGGPLTCLVLEESRYRFL